MFRRNLIIANRKTSYLILILGFCSLTVIRAQIQDTIPLIQSKDEFIESIETLEKTRIPLETQESPTDKPAEDLQLEGPRKPQSEQKVLEREVENLVEEAVKAWETSMQVVVTSEAQEEIFQLVVGHELEGVPNEDITGIVAHHLSQIREQKLSETGQIDSITLEDIKRGLQLLTVIVAVSKNKPTGYLRVTSGSLEASIRIDGNRKGNTPQTFVLSPGEHKVELKMDRLFCSGIVRVRADSTTAFYCYIVD